MTYGELFERADLPDDQQRYILQRFWESPPVSLDHEPLALERLEVALFAWLHQVGRGWLSPLFHDAIVHHCRPALQQLADLGDLDSWTGVGVLDFRWVTCAGTPQFLDLTTGQKLTALEVPAVTYLWCDLAVLDRRLRCPHLTHEPAAT